MNRKVKYVAELDDVFEITLLGSADLAYWRDRLASHGLIPAGADGMAQVRISAASARYMGVPFREVSISVAVERPSPALAYREHAYLLHAFNSSRIYAFAERALFSTPYSYARCEIVAGPPGRITVTEGATTLLSLSGASTGCEVRTVESDSWHGTVSLPAENRPHRYFVAEIVGTATVYPFRPHLDHLLIDPSGNPSLSQLCDSGFEGREWLVRKDASHAKSKTYRMGGAA